MCKVAQEARGGLRWFPGPRSRPTAKCPPQLSFRANFLSLTSCRGCPRLSVPASCVKARGTVNTAHQGREAASPAQSHLLQCLAGKCQPGELGNHDEKTPETELNELHPDLLVGSTGLWIVWERA